MALAANMIERNAPHPVPLSKLALASLQLRVSAFAGECGWGEGTVLHALSVIQASLLQPYPLADAATLRCKLAKASLPGEGQDEGRFVQNLAHPRNICPAREV